MLKDLFSHVNFMYVVFGHFSGIVSQSVIWRIRTFEIECQIIVFPHMFTPFFLTKKSYQISSWAEFENLVN